MKTLPALAILALALPALAAAPQDPARITLAPKVGDKTVHAVSMSVSVQGVDGLISANLESTVKSVDENAVEILTKWNDLKVEAAGNDVGAPAVDMDRKVAKNGQPISVEGGIEGMDPLRTTLLFTFLYPSAEVAPDGTYDVSYEPTKESGLGKITFHGKYVGAADANGEKGMKFETTLTEEGDTGLKVNNTYVVSADGRILSVDGKFENYPIPAFAVTATGTVKVNIAK